MRPRAGTESRGRPWRRASHQRHQRPHDRRAARRAVRRHRRPARRARARHRRLRSNDRKLLFEDIGVITMRPSDVPTYVEAGAADLGVTGKDVLLEQSAQRPGRRARGVRAARPRLRALHDGARQQGRPRSGARGAAPAGRDARRHQVPAHRRALPRGDRPAGRDRRGQGLGRARAADRHGRGDRRPHRHRHDAARERPRGARGDRRVHRAADRQPGRPQAQGRADRRAARACAPAASRAGAVPASSPEGPPDMRIER